MALLPTAVESGRKEYGPMSGAFVNPLSDNDGLEKNDSKKDGEPASKTPVRGPRPHFFRVLLGWYVYASD